MRWDTGRGKKYNLEGKAKTVFCQKWHDQLCWKPKKTPGTNMLLQQGYKTQRQYFLSVSFFYILAKNKWNLKFHNTFTLVPPKLNT